MKTSQQLREEQKHLQTDLAKIKERRIEATLSGEEFNETARIAELTERITVLDEAIVVAEKREEVELKRRQREAEIQRRAEQRQELQSIATAAVKEALAAEASLRQFVKHMSALMNVHVRQKAATARVPSARELNIANEEIFFSELVLACLHAIPDQYNSSRNHYGRIAIGSDADTDWKEPLEARYNGWANGLISILDRKDREADNDAE